MAKYIGKRIVPVHCGVWDQTRSYEMLSIVLDTASGDSYISRRDVPSGTALTDQSYWMLHSLFSQQIRDMSDQLTATEQRIAEDNQHTSEEIEGMVAGMTARVNSAESSMTRQKASFDETAASLNTRMDAVLAAGTGTGETEILDARVDMDGNTHDTLGTAIRSGDMSVMEKLTRRIDGITEPTRNLWKFGDADFTQFKMCVCDPPIPAGTYTFSAVISSEDTDSAKSRVGFYTDPDQSHRISSNNLMYKADLERDTRSHCTFTVEQDIELILLEASISVAGSEGDHAAYSQIQLEAGDNLTSYVPGETAVDFSFRENVHQELLALNETNNQTHAALSTAISSLGADVNSRLDGITEITRNLWKYGDQEITTFKIIVCDPPIPAGAYTFSAVAHSEDTDASKCRVSFYRDPNKTHTVGPSALITTSTIDRDKRSSFAFEAESDIELILLDASTTVALSEGDAAAFSQIQIEEGSQLTEYTPHEVAVDYAVRRGFLQSTGDNRDRTAEIMESLNLNGVCRLGAGEFYVNGVDMPEGTAILGSGPATKLILSGTGEGYAIRMTTRCTVDNLSIIGAAEDIELSNALEERHGILWLGGGSSDNPERGTISNCVISRFTGGGITCTDSGYGTQCGMNVMNCQIFNCNVGVNITHWSEYHRFTNVNMNHCYYGCINNGGNNMFANCGFSSNILGMLLDNEDDKSRNNTHGSAVGCVFNHTDGNTGTAIKIVNCHAGYIFDGCQVYYGKIEIITSSRMVFSNINFGKSVELHITGGNLSLFSGCVFRSDLVAEITDNSKVRFNGCYDNNGTEINPIA